MKQEKLRGMLSGVNWLNYWLFVSGAAVIWWMGVIVIFYRKKLIKLISDGRRSEVHVEYVEEPQQEIVEVSKPDPLLGVQKVIAEIKLVFASVTKETPSEFIRSSLREILATHQYMQNPEFNQGVADLIQSCASRAGREPLSDEDLEFIFKS